MAWQIWKTTNAKAQCQIQVTNYIIVCAKQCLWNFEVCAREFVFMNMHVKRGFLTEWQVWSSQLWSDLSKCNISPKKNEASTGFEPRTFALPMRFSNNWTIKCSNYVITWKSILAIGIIFFVWWKLVMGPLPCGTNTLNWRERNPLGQDKQSVYIIENGTFHCLSCPSWSLALQLGVFVTRDWPVAKGPWWWFANWFI